MAKITLSSIKDCEVIFSDGRDVILSGKSCWLFRADGTPVTKLKGLRRISKVAFLANHTALVDARGNKMYVHLSLEDGSVLWSVPKDGTSFPEAPKFVISEDRKAIYSFRKPLKLGDLIIDRIRPESQEYDTVRLPASKRFWITSGAFLDKMDMFCILRYCSMRDEEEEERIYPQSLPPVFHFEIVAIPFDKDGEVFFVQKEWDVTNNDLWIEWCDGRYILLRDLSVQDLSNNSIFPLLKGDQPTAFSDARKGFEWDYNRERGLLTLSFLSNDVRAVIDCNTHKIVAQYQRRNKSIGFVGCVINDEFWIGSMEGVLRLPFPPADSEA